MNRALVLFGAALAACGRPAGEVRSAAAARGFHYWDDAGLEVTTLATDVAVPVSRSVLVEGRAIAERIRVGANADALGGAHAHSGHGPSGHEHGSAGGGSTGVDVVSSASTTARVGGDSTLWRYEGQLGARAGIGSAKAPADVGLEARVSTEPDYLSLSTAATGRVDLFERNLVLAGSLGVARDRIDPASPPPGSSRAWPAHHDRAYTSVSLSQVLGPRTVVGGNLTVSTQLGALENPYRRALVRTTLFPERVPDVRRRLTGSASVAQYLGRGAAAHLRSGVYADDWGVLAWIPEAAAAWSTVTGMVLLDVHARYYAQSAARFYAHHYDDLEPELTADVRLGALRELSLGAFAAVRLLGRSSPVGELSVSGGYDLSRLHYRATDRRVTGHLTSLSLRLSP